ncbi:MAG: hypothetical protein HY667_02965, partial [Chloroflexi bacterium]|nr:hypothetical protein [Chloroflexota bacterium]
FTWRIVAHHIKRQIITMYPRVIELEHMLGWTVHTAYYYNNLSPDGREIINGALPELPPDPRERHNYFLFARECEINGRTPHGLLLEVWDEQGFGSVGSLGHAPQDVAVYLLSLVSLAIAWMFADKLASCTTAVYSPLWAAAVVTLLLAVLATLFFWLIIWPGRAWN